MIKKQGGFTFIELILCMVLSAILAGVVVEIIAGPIRAYFWYTQRNQYVDMAQMSLETIQSDLQTSLPSSIRLNNQTQDHSLNFRNIVYKGIALPNGKVASRNLSINSELPDNLILAKNDQELFIVFPAVNSMKDKLYPFAITNSENGSAISLIESLVVQYPTPFYVVSGLATYECAPDAHTLVRKIAIRSDQNQQSLLSNVLSDCQFTLLDGNPKKVLVSLSFGKKKSQITLSQPIVVGSQL